MTTIGFTSTHGACAHYRAELPSRVLGLYAPALTVVLGDDLAYNALLGSPIGLYHELGDQTDHEGTTFFEPEVLVLAGGYPRGLGADVIRVARAHGQRIICDCDDWNELPPENPHYVPEGAERKLEALRAASAVTVSTPAIGADLMAHGIGSTLIRNSIDTNRYRRERDENQARLEAAELVEHANGYDPDELVIAYRGLLAGFHDADVRELYRKLPTEGVRYVHVGADPRSEHTFAELAGVPAELVHEIQAVPFELYGPQLAGIDVALIPLSSRPFSHAKSAISALEWHAAGVPWIGSPHPELMRAATRGSVGPARKWGEALEILRSPANRRELYQAQHPPSEPLGAPWSELVLSVLERPA